MKHGETLLRGQDSPTLCVNNSESHTGYRYALSLQNPPWAGRRGQWEGFGSSETPMRIFSFTTRAIFVVVVVQFLVASF